MAFKDLFRGPISAIRDSFKKSQEWLNDMMQALLSKTNDNTTKTDDENDKKRLNFKGVSRPEPGKLYFFMYHDPKYKSVLPYYDRFPMVIAVEEMPLKDGMGFLGLNLHYLPPHLRAVILDELIMTYPYGSEDTNERKLSVDSYETLRAFITNVPMVKSCIKKYYYGRIVSSKFSKGAFNEIHPNDWKYAVTLPLHEWVRNPNYSGPLPW